MLVFSIFSIRLLYNFFYKNVYKNLVLQDNWGFILFFIWYFFLWLKNSKPSFYFFVKFLPWTRCSYALHSYHSTMLPVISLSPLLHSISWKPTIEPLMSSLNQLDAWILWFLTSVISCIFPMYMCFTVKTSFIFFFSEMTMI